MVSNDFLRYKKYKLDKLAVFKKIKV